MKNLLVFLIMTISMANQDIQAQIKSLSLNNGNKIIVGNEVGIGKGEIGKTGFKTKASSIYFTKSQQKTLYFNLRFNSSSSLHIPRGTKIKIRYNNEEEVEITTQEEQKASWDNVKNMYKCGFWVELSDENIEFLLTYSINKITVSYSQMQIAWYPKKYSEILQSAKMVKETAI